MPFKYYIMSEVSIHTFGEKIKGRVGEHRHTLLYALILIVVAGGAFYLGYSARASKTNDAQVAIYCPESAYMPSISQQGTSVAPTPSNAQNGAYIASKKIKDSYNTRTFVVYDGREISSKYDFVTGLVKIGNKLAYSATSKDGGGNVIVYDGVEVSTKLCLNAYAPTNINGKLAFNCSQKNGSALMVLDGIEIPHEKRYGLDSHTPPVDIGGKLAYAVIDTGDTFHWKSTLLVDGVDIGLTKYTSIDQLYSANGKPLFMARKLPDNVEHALVYNGVEIAKDYNYIDSVVQVGDKSIFIARKDEGRSSVYTMFVDGVAQSTKYDVIAGLAEIDGSVAYHAETGKKSFIVYKGKEFGKEYDSVGGPANINNKLAFVATKNSKSFVVMEK
jgi:hypothetical protein